MRIMLKRGLSFLIAFVLVLGLLPEPVEAVSSSTYYIKINRQQNCVTVYEKDKNGNYTVPVRAMVCSTGANQATPLGRFRIGGKYRWHELNGPVYGQYCSRITGHVLFHSVYYSTTDPSTLNYNAYNRLGNAASHGCVRLTVADAKWIYDNCPSGTVVEIYDSSNPGPLGKPEPIRIDSSSRYRGWDPTDPDEKNPWPKAKPTIKGAKNKTIERCSPKSKVTSGVSAADYSGKKLNVKVSGKYDLNRTGKYKVTYKAADACGNQTSKTVTITVKDTKAPKLTVQESELTITDDTDEINSVDELKDYIRSFASATDSGEKLGKKYIVVLAKKLCKAWELCDYGTYTVEVYAKDKAGNKSRAKSLKIHYYAEEPDNPDQTDNPDQPDNSDQTDNPGDSDPAQSTDDAGQTDTTENSDPAQSADDAANADAADEKQTADAA